MLPKRNDILSSGLQRCGAATLVALGFLLGGCEWKGASSQLGGPTIIAAAWQPRPVQMRVYPSSRFVTDSHGSVLEARIELLDEMGDSVKGAGTLQIELLTAVEARQAETSRRLYAWRAEVLTIEQQRQHYDPITRAYLFRLKMDQAPDAQHHTMLWVTFTPVQGDRIEARAAMDDVIHP